LSFIFPFSGRLVFFPPTPFLCLRLTLLSRSIRIAGSVGACKGSLLATGVPPPAFGLVSWFCFRLVPYDFQFVLVSGVVGFLSCGASYILWRPDAQRVGGIGPVRSYVSSVSWAMPSSACVTCLRIIRPVYLRVVHSVVGCQALGISASSLLAVVLIPSSCTRRCPWTSPSLCLSRSHRGRFGYPLYFFPGVKGVNRTRSVGHVLHLSHFMLPSIVLKRLTLLGTFQRPPTSAPAKSPDTRVRTNFSVRSFRTSQCFLTGLGQFCPLLYLMFLFFDP